MTFTLARLEDMAAWCSTCAEMAPVRGQAWRQFFGDDDPRPVKYWPGTDDVLSKQRRFLGWFMFSFMLDDGRRPAEVAADKLYSGLAREEALEAVRAARYVLAVVTGVIPGRGVFLELEDEQFEVRSRTLSQFLKRGMGVVAYLVPSHRGLSIPGPGWVQLPVAIGPNMRRELKDYQSDPILIERMLQGRSDERRGRPAREYPKDRTVEQAVTRMTEAATAEGRTGLIMSPEEWKRLVLKHLRDADITAFTQEIIPRVGPVKDVDEMNRWLALAVNIWNATPQPDRGGRTANQLADERLKGRIQD